VVPTVSFRILYVFLVLSHERRRVWHFNVTEHPTAEWTAGQLMQAFPWDTAPRYMLRDRDRVYGEAFRTLAAEMEITEVLTAPRSPWQSPYVERLIGSIRRECLDHVVVMNESSLRREMACYLDYYHGSRSHLSIGKDSPDGRAVEPPERGRIVAVPKVAGFTIDTNAEPHKLSGSCPLNHCDNFSFHGTAPRHSQPDELRAIGFR
jgi:putative transposase